MKKYFFLLILSIFIISCSKKEVIISGQVANASPLSRVEIIDVSSIATLPIANIGFDNKGNFADTLSIDKNGIYAIVYNGRANFIYLKKGQNITLSGNSSNFPEDIKISGESKNNNEFLAESQKFINEYLAKLDHNLFKKEEADFMKNMEKFATDINHKLDEIAKNKKVDNEVVQWKKDDLLVNLLVLSSQYELMHGQITQKPNFKLSKNFLDKRKLLEKESFIKDFPAYRQYILIKLQEDFKKFATPYLQDTQTTQTEVFIKFLDTRKDLSQETKDYLISFIATQHDLYPENEKADQVLKTIQEKVKSQSIKNELEKVFNTISGIKIGTSAPEVSLLKQDGKTTKISDFKNKPTLLVFYSSYAPGMVEQVVPTLKEISDFYHSKMNILHINMDDNAKQFQDTSKALMKDLKGINLYAKGGLKSDVAKQYYIYGFKLPSFLVLDKEGKIASKMTLNLVSPQFIETLNKQTGLTAPIQPQILETKEMHHHENDGHNH